MADEVGDLAGLVHGAEPFDRGRFYHELDPKSYLVAVVVDFGGDYLGRVGGTDMVYLRFVVQVLARRGAPGGL